MIRNYFRTALRNFTRERAFAFINLVGLALGIACALVLTTFLREETSYDLFHEDADRIYRLISEDSLGGDLMRNSNVIGLAAPRFQERVPQIDATVRMHREQVVISVDDLLFEESEFFWSDSSLFQVFDFPLGEGDPSTALGTPGTAVISRATAKRLFGDTAPIGRVLRVDSKHDLEVTGVLEDVPAQSHLHPEIIASILTLGDMSNPWVSEHQGWSYVRLIPGSDAAEVEQVMNSVISEVVTWLDMDALYWAFRLQPLSDVRLHSAGISVPGDVGDIRYVFLFGAITALILFIACVNFTNLATARSLKRVREVAMRKTLGASRRQIAFQFLGESIGLAALAAVVASALIWLGRPYITTVFGRPIQVDFLADPSLIGWLLVLSVVTGLAAGWVPAVFVSRFDPIRALKGLAVGRRRSLLRQSLVVVQFTISVALIFLSLVIGGQMRFIQENNLGFRTDGILSVRMSGFAGDQDAFKRLVMDQPGVISASYASGFPMGGGLVSDSEVDGVKVATMRLPVDEDYLETMGLELTAGRNYDADREGDSEASMVVSQSFVRMRGWDNPLSERVPNGVDEDGSTRYADIIGVVSDFHTGSMHKEIMPTIFDAGKRMAQFRRALIVRVAEGNIQATIARLESVWTELVPDRPFSIRFADEYVQSQYKAEERMGSLFGFFMWLSIGIAGLGLFGLAAYAVERRTKEMGIRKVMGASVTRISVLLMTEYLALVVVAVAIGLPIAWLGASTWLKDFAYRTEITPMMFMYTALGVLSFAVIAVLSQALRGASADPVDTLRHE